MKAHHPPLSRVPETSGAMISHQVVQMNDAERPYFVVQFEYPDCWRVYDARGGRGWSVLGKDVVL